MVISLSSYFSNSLKWGQKLGEEISPMLSEDPVWAHLQNMSIDKSVGPNYMHHWILGKMADLISKQLSPSYFKSPSLVLVWTGFFFFARSGTAETLKLLYTDSYCFQVGKRDSLPGCRDSSWLGKHGWGSHLVLSVFREFFILNHLFYRLSLPLLLLAFLFLSHPVPGSDLSPWFSHFSLQFSSPAGRWVVWRILEKALNWATPFLLMDIKTVTWSVQLQEKGKQHQPFVSFVALYWETFNLILIWNFCFLMDFYVEEDCGKILTSTF